MKKIWVVRGNICKNENKFLREISIFLAICTINFIMYILI